MGERSEGSEWEGSVLLSGRLKTRGGLHNGQRARPQKTCPRESDLRGGRIASSLFSCGLLQLTLIGILLLVQTSTAAFVPFENCLSKGIINSNPPQLQFQPLFVWVTFNASADSHNVNITAYGNVAGIATQQPYPPVNDPQWKDPNQTVGKIPDLGGQGNQQKYTTFETELNVLDYTPYDPPPVRFCNSSSLTQCPLAPVFNFTGNA